MAPVCPDVRVAFHRDGTELADGSRRGGRHDHDLPAKLGVVGSELTVAVVTALCQERGRAAAAVAVKVSVPASPLTGRR